MLIDVKPHPVHEGIFVSPNGEVYRRLATSVGSSGYHTVKVTRGGTIRRHTLVLETYKGPSDGLWSRHLDGNPANDSKDNLAWGTQKENMNDAVIHGTTTKGSKNARAKLTEAEVLEIKARLAKGESGSALAREFRVSAPTICDIKSERTWGWL
jgi:hypothetical protein